MSFFAALQFLTVIPIGRREVRPETMARSVVYFPLIGLIIGLIMAGWRWLLGLLTPPPVAIVLLLASMVAITGALHLDGFLDTCDGLAGHHTVKERLAIMHDSRAGGIGVVGVVIILLVKYIALTNVPQLLITPVIVLAPVMARWAMVYAIFSYPYARLSGLGKLIKERTNWLRFAIATIIALAVAMGTLQLTGVVIMLVVWLVTVITAIILGRAFAGLTGDCYGFIAETVETFVFVMIIMLSRTGLA